MISKPTRHTNAVKLILLELSHLNCLAARREVGLFYDKRGNPRKIGVDGEADIQGITPTGRAIAVEVKIGRDKVREDQSTWAQAWEKRNGLYAVISTDWDDWKEQLRELVQ